jgi:hypothetical protein
MYTSDHLSVRSTSLMRWNPFLRLIESRNYPYARLIRSSLRERIWDTYYIFFGSVFHDDLGVLDYLFFPIPILEKTIFLINNLPAQYLKFFTPLLILLIIPWAALCMIKASTAGILTVLITPLVLLTHLICNPIWKQKANLIENIIVRPVDKQITTEEEYPKFNADIKLKDLDQFSYSENLIRPLAAYENDYQHFTCTYWPQETILFLGVFEAHFTAYFMTPRRPINLRSHGEMKAVIEINANNWKGIQAMLQTNSLWSCATVESNSLCITEDVHEEIEKQIIPRLAKKAFLDGFSRTLRNHSPLKKFAEYPHFEPKVVGIIFEFPGYPKGYRNMQPSAYIAERKNNIRP